MMKTNPADDTISTRDAAGLLKVSVRTIQLWVEQKQLSAWKTPGGHRRVLKTSVEQMCARRLRQSHSAGVFEVLILDDDELFVQLSDVYRCVTDSEIRILTFNNSIESLIHIGETAPGLLVMDLMDTHLDAFELLNILRTRPWGKEMQIILTTSMDEEAVRNAGSLPDGIHLFRKPLSFPHLLKTIGRCFDIWKTKRNES